MRVTDGMVWNNVKRGVASGQSNYVKAQQAALSGKKVNSPSDDPAAFAGARTETGNLKRAEGYERTINNARPSLETTDGALSDVEDVMRRIRTIAIQGGSDTYNASDRATLSNELGQLRDQLVNLGNTNSGNRFVFGGYKDTAPPYDATGTFTGATETASVEIARNVKVPMGVSGNAVFGETGADIFTTIASMQTALAADDGPGVSNLITEMDVHYERVRSVHSEIGLHQNSADIAEAVVQKAADSATKAKSGLVDVDAADAYSSLIRAQGALAAAIEIASQLPMPGLAGRSR